MHASGQASPSVQPVIVARSVEMRRVIDLARRAATSDATVLVQGETGTGKELIARLIHSSSGRRDGPFVPVNCGGFSDSLLASELFGHKRGAFTGAVADRAGVFEVASGGTVFLDEIGAMSSAMQVKLLRVFQEQTVTPVGSSEQRAIDVRVVAATNADLAELVKSRQFREDLYYRVKVVSCRLPPLRERRDDIKPLLDHYLAYFLNQSEKSDITLSPSAEERLIGYDWPGNVRQLRSEMEQIVAMADSDTVIGPGSFSEDLHGHPAPRPASVDKESDSDVGSRTGAVARDSDSTYQELLDVWTRQVVSQRLSRFGGNVAKTAQSLSISRTTLYALLKKYGFHGRDD